MAASAVLERTNAAIDREERVEAVEELKNLVEDWKGHRIEGFGDLLMYGQFTVLKGDTVNAKNEEREVCLLILAAMSSRLANNACSIRSTSSR